MAVSKVITFPQSEFSSSAEETHGTELPEDSDSTSLDLEAALRSLAFLIEFVMTVGPDELRKCADQIAAARTGVKP